ncbi:hypothetical protein [Vibrio harveyi]|uniref:hypothetical protein n=1 Tax=Vibrio harveyi TaxID=669 RepID=UPI000681477C|nr:hypothetical protein [Vibrio harveyi]EKO3785701.1 hypothetical protein [Vibrio harveyi]WDZ71763.1 hypothetical protein PWW31_11405 [Vibrio harveyi]
MNISIWKSRRNKNQLVASQSNGIHIYFDSFELEEIEASLWLYQGSTLIACFEANSNTLSRLRQVAKHMATLGAQNHGEPLTQIKVVQS